MSRLSKLNLILATGTDTSQIPASGHRAPEEKVEADSGGAHQAEEGFVRQDCF